MGKKEGGFEFFIKINRITKLAAHHNRAAHMPFPRKIYHGFTA